MYQYGLTKKQCGVIFANVKNGNITINGDFTKWLYEWVCGNRKLMNQPEASILKAMHNGLDDLFAGKIQEAEATFANAFVDYCSKHSAAGYAH